MKNDFIIRNIEEIKLIDLNGNIILNWDVRPKNILSLFDGMSCGMIAFKRADIIVGNYYAYEIDKYCIQTSLHNFPDIKQCGDVFKGDFTQYKDIDYLLGGSPCTYWSIAQSPDKRETTASGLGWELFSQYIRALNEAKPKYFIYENNKSMSKAIYNSISEAFGFEPIMINSALVSAQNRCRYYWVGKRQNDGTYSKVEIKQPEDEGILLKDILDSGYDLTNRDKSFVLTASYGGAVPWNTIERHQRSMIIEPVGVASRSRGIPREQHIEAREDEKSNCLTTAQKDCMVAVPIEYNDDVPAKATSQVDGKTYDVYEVKNGYITIKNKTYPIKLQDGYYIIRKLTISEAKRLQTVPEWYNFPVSNTQAYKMLGNGWTCDVITHLIKSTLSTK